ncbi:MAG TPA: hypothetical protein VK790_09915 [Solirubrobacteraceae bacterium]|nr:hypothetical protein [Solirubrobacteraceae bacterium]
MERGKVAIEHDHVVVVDQCARQTGFAVERDVDCHSRMAQARGDRRGQLLVVLDHQHSHQSLRVEKVAPRRFMAVSSAPPNEPPHASGRETRLKQATA